MGSHPNDTVSPSLDRLMTSSMGNAGSTELMQTPLVNKANVNELFNGNPNNKKQASDPEVSSYKDDLEQVKNSLLEKNEDSVFIPNDRLGNSISKVVPEGYDVSTVDKELFGDDEDDEDLFGESNDNSLDDENRVTDTRRNDPDEITEDMFGMSDDDDGTNKASYATNTNTNIDTFFDSANSLSTPIKKSNLKRKYLDIPIEEITLPNDPLYTDPGAPLPVETPRDRRKSVFAPLNFNPIIESNVDNKYRNGGKFSFSPIQKDESLKFDLSSGAISSSEDEESDSDDDDFAYLTLGQDLRSMDGEPHDQSHFLGYPPIPGAGEPLSMGYNGGNDFIVGTEAVKDGSNSIWRLPQSELPTTDSPLKTVESSIQPMDPKLKSAMHESNMTTRPKITEEQSPASAGNIIQSSLPEGHATLPEITPTGTNLIVESSNSLPFLLRHMPLSSIPDVFRLSNPSIPLSEMYPDMLDLLSEQIVFDYDALQNMGIPRLKYKGINECKKGLVYDTLSKIFTAFERIDGNQIIDKFYPIKQPFVFIRKNQELIKIKADFQPFCKYLNLRPPNGIKNFKCLILTDSFKDDCINFVSTLSQSYIGHEYGFCELLKLNAENYQGLIYLKDFGKNRLLLLAAQIVSYCATNKSSEKDVPLMMILPLNSNDLSELVRKVKIFQTIRNEVKAKISNKELFLKVIPMDFISNPLTSVDDCSNLCVSIYNILPLKLSKFTTIAKKLPETITFRTLQNSTGSAAIHYDEYIHLAYARSLDKAWVFAALTDSNGNENLIKSWYVGTSKTKFDDACNQIWSLALSLSNKKYGKICLILTRLDGILPDDELMNWRRLSGRNIHLAVVCVDDNTKITFLDKDRLYPTFKPILRDEKLARKFNPNNFDDYELRNTDEDIHGVIFQNPFLLSNSQHRCAIKSGALIKFRRCRDDTIWDKFEVNLLNCPHADSTELLETILEEFRNLASLNIWFGVSNGEHSHIPWHVLAVKKMMNTLVHARVDVLEEPIS